MKLTFLQVEEAFARCLYGESARSIARSMGVTEGALRFHFRKGKSPREVRQIAFDLLAAEQRSAQLTANLSPAELAQFNREVVRLRRASHCRAAEPAILAG